MRVALLTLVTIVIFIIVGFTIKGRSRTFDLALIAFLSVVSALNTTHADYLNYLVLYRSSYLSFGSNDGEIGWQALCYIGNMLGLSYQVFFGVLLFVVLCAAYVLMRVVSFTAVSSVCRYRPDSTTCCCGCADVWILAQQQEPGDKGRRMRFGNRPHCLLLPFVGAGVRHGVRVALGFREGYKAHGAQLAFDCVGLRGFQ